MVYKLCNLVYKDLVYKDVSIYCNKAMKDQEEWIKKNTQQNEVLDVAPISKFLMQRFQSTLK